MGEALNRGMTLVMSIWDDFATNMLWLDGDFPLTDDRNKPGVQRGPCARDSGYPMDVRSRYPESFVKYSSIKVGAIGSTSQAVAE